MYCLYDSFWSPLHSFHLCVRRTECACNIGGYFCIITSPSAPKCQRVWGTTGYSNNLQHGEAATAAYHRQHIFVFPFKIMAEACISSRFNLFPLLKTCNKQSVVPIKKKNKYMHRYKVYSSKWTKKRWKPKKKFWCNQAASNSPSPLLYWHRNST